MERYLLLVSCSNRKNWDIQAPTPAIDVYDGAFYRVIKKSINSKPDILSKLSMYILSAKYNIIPDNFEILPYDQKMTDSEALSKSEDNTEILNKYIQKENPSELVVVMGKTYRDSILWENIDTPKKFITGEIGEMQSKLKNWLLSL